MLLYEEGHLAQTAQVKSLLPRTLHTRTRNWADSMPEFLSYSQTGYACTIMVLVHCCHDFTSAGKLYHSIHRPAQRKTPILQLRLLITAFWFPKIHLNSTTFPNGPQVADLNAICKVIFKVESVLMYSFFQHYLQVIY